MKIKIISNTHWIDLKHLNPTCQNNFKKYGTMCCKVPLFLHIFAIPITVLAKVVLIKKFYTFCNDFSKASS